MNIIVEGTKEILYSPYLQNHEEYQIIDPTWTEEVNKAGSLEFTILPGHCLYSSYKKLSTILDITDDSGNDILWRGRILNDQKDFYLKKQVYCEGSLAFLLDSVVRPYNYKSTTIDAWFSDMIKNHNSQVDTEKQFINGGCDTFSYKVSTSTNDYSQTLDALQDKVNALGGYLKLDNKILSWSASSGQISDQVIRFGENLLDFTDYIDGADVYTVLIPLGKTTDDVALTIKTANNGKDYLESDTGIALFGRIVKTATYSEIEDAEELKKQGMSDLLDNIKLAVTITVTAADLSYLDADVKSIRCGDYVRIISPPHEIDSYFQCTKIVHYLDAPEKNEYTFGRSMYSLSDASTEHTANNYASFVKIKDTTTAIKETTKALEQDVEVISATADEAKAAADAAKTQAEAAEDASNAAKETAEGAKSTADSALASANEAQNTANAARDAAGEVTEKVTGIVKDVNDAKTAADNAWKAASTAKEDAATAKTSATNAEKNAADAKTAADAASTKSDEAVSTATAAQSDAAEAKTNATKASETAAAAKADAAQAQKEIDSLGENLTTLSNTMKADYARKTDLTEAEASLSTKISQNSAKIETTAKKVSVIDETANNAADLAATAQTKAEAAQTKADQATSEAAAAQTKADEASQAAQTAQSNADTAKAAAENAQSVADKAKTDLAEAQKNLATVKGRVDATEGDIAKAQEAVTTAQAAAEKAQSDANAAATKASSAQDIADAAKANASLAQTAASQASAKAEAAQTIANEAKVNASDAQKKAADAVKTAGDAKTAANNAAQTASDAQDIANAAKANATAAQAAADDAKKKSDQAAADLVTAKNNLAEVSGRVDSTAEEIEAAKTAVATAQAAADKAKTDAAAAQSTADTAKTNASNAQKAADTAKTAADNAKKAADDAQKAADKAQDDVNALTKRVVNAETSIKQNSEAIALRATKTEVAQSIKDLQDDATTKANNALASAKTYADAQIKVTADGINQNVTKVQAASIISSQEQFYQSTSPTSLTGGSWSNTQPSWANDKYIWRRTLVTYGNNKTGYTPSETGVCITGNTGATGKGIKSTAITYQASSSGTTVPTGTWVTSVPATNAVNPYLWTRTVITYTDNTNSTSYAVGSTLEGVSVGGRNLILNGKGNKKAGFFKNFTTVTDEYGEFTLTSKKEYVSIYIRGGFLLGCRDYTVGEKVTWSYDIMYTAWNFPSGTDRNEFWIGQRYTNAPSGETATGTWTGVTKHTLPVVGQNGCELNKWFHVKKTFTIPKQASSNVGTTASILFYNSNANVAASFTARLKNVKLERGNVATDWTPAPEDYLTSDETTDKITELRQEVNSNIEQTGEAIKSSVYEKVYLKDDVDTLLSSVNTEVEQTKTSWQVTFNQLVKQLNDYSDGSDAAFDEIRKYIRFEDGNILLGNSSSPLILRIRNDRIQFLQNGYEVAYISDQRMYNTTCEIINQLRIADSAWTVETNSNGDTIVSLIGL